MGRFGSFDVARADVMQPVPQAVESDGPPVTIIIPLGGIGARFTREGHTSRPKPFVRVLGKEILIWIIESLCMRDQDALVIVYNPAFANIKVCMENLLLARSVNRIHIVELPGETRGAADTAGAVCVREPTGAMPRGKQRRRGQNQRNNSEKDYARQNERRRDETGETQSDETKTFWKAKVGTVPDVHSSCMAFLETKKGWSGTTNKPRRDGCKS